MNPGKRTIILLVVVLSLLLLGAGVANAVTNSYALSWWTIESSAALEGTGGYKLHGTAGQPDAISTIPSDSGKYTIGAGFWNPGLLSGASIPITLTVQSGYKANQLEWTVANDPGVIEYQVSRAISGTPDLAPIALVSDKFYYDRDATLVSGTTYCYQVKALRSNHSVSVASNTQCVVAGQLHLWVPDVWAVPGDLVMIPVNIQNADELQIFSTEIWLDYNDAVICPVKIASPPLMMDYDWDYDIIVNPGFDQVRMTTAGGISPPILYGEGSLVWLTVEVLGNSGNQSPLNLKEFIHGIGGSVIYAPENLAQPILMRMSSGNLYVEGIGAYRRGDLNGDGHVMTVDAVTALQISSGQLIPKPEQISAGDINGDGVITSADASMIAYYAVHGTWPPPPPKPDHRLLQSNAPIELRLGQYKAGPGATITAFMQVAGLSDWAGGDFTILYDPTFMDVVDVQPVGIANQFKLEYEDLSGLLNVSMADKVTVNGNGDLFAVTFRIKETSPVGQSLPINIAAVGLNDLNGRDFVTSVLKKEIIKVAGQINITGAKIFLPLIARP